MGAESAPPAHRPARNAEETRARILDTARREFVTHGLNGARVDRIAAQAGVNKNLIYHYFGSKESLYLEILERIYAGLRTRQRDESLRDLPPAAAMAALVANTFDHLVSTPDLIRLMSIENIHFGQHLKRSTSVKPLYRNLLDTIDEILKRGQAAGTFRHNVDAVDLYLSISGLAYFFLSNQHTLSWLLDRDFMAGERVAVRRRHVVEMVLSYLTGARSDLSPAAAHEGPEVGP
ncbi:transcriptional regulator, TetR family [Methylobacterium sp. 4-46]|uniref:TetR/AcrR family transcriptional regulator n=1 Tax=unclassified Methylobacterium TaxID=2615210 RepID=UPI000152DA97|nr:MULTISPECIES: TetR/AcrR family transcriptional regulator [Methylobacterium]ACA19939.1 transcriptional regulator, TetR family [Methylobacterium sp. 4-46]WFT79125.1 TetR/AcrR family transcriptional regulator [Methylobacterium nodulans]